MPLRLKTTTDDIDLTYCQVCYFEYIQNIMLAELVVKSGVRSYGDLHK